MGFSLPAAIGAKFAAPNRQIVAFTGDGGLQMNVQELMTIGHRRLNIKCIVFNNDTLGMMREVQIRYFGSRFHGASDRDFSCPDLKLLAAAYGVEYLLVDSMDRLPEMGRCLTDSRPWIVDVRISKNSKLLNRYDEKHIFESEKLSD